MERDKIKEQFEALAFHCNWVLHSQLRGPTAQAILSRFDAASLVLKNNKVALRDLPSDLKAEIDKISKNGIVRGGAFGCPRYVRSTSVDRKASSGWVSVQRLASRVPPETGGGKEGTILQAGKLLRL
jgi:hypothetical protein